MAGTSQLVDETLLGTVESQRESQSTVASGVHSTSLLQYFLQAAMASARVPPLESSLEQAPSTVWREIAVRAKIILFIVLFLPVSAGERPY